VLSFAAAGRACAQGYPAKPVRVIAPYAAVNSGTPGELTAFVRKGSALYAKIIQS